MSKKIIIAMVTAGRSDYDLLYPLIKKILANNNFDLRKLQKLILARKSNI